MNYLQLLSLVVIVVILVVCAAKFLLRNRSKGCHDCLKKRQATPIDFTKLKEDVNLIRDSDSESDLSDDEEEENGKGEQHVAAQAGQPDISVAGGGASENAAIDGDRVKDSE